MSFLFLMVGMLMQVSDLPCAFQRRAVWLEKSSIEVEGHVMTFSDYVKISNQKNKTWSAQDPEAFWSYSKALYTGMFAKVLRQTFAIDIFQSCANAFCQVARCVCLQLEQQLRSFYCEATRRFSLLTGCALYIYIIYILRIYIYIF